MVHYIIATLYSRHYGKRVHDRCKEHCKNHSSIEDYSVKINKFHFLSLREQKTHMLHSHIYL